MNTYLYLIMLVAYVVMAAMLVRDYRKAYRVYNIKHNGSRFVVRDKKGRFVTIAKSRWDIAALGGGF